MRRIVACTLLVMSNLACAGEWYTTIEGCQIWNEFPQPNASISWKGDCIEGKASGKGTSMWFYDNADGQLVIDQYVGEMKAGKNHGSGSYHMSSGARYEGQWQDNRLHGHGTFQFANGDRYVGQWEAGNRQGHGTYYEADGDRQAGYFRQNVLWDGWVHFGNSQSCEIRDGYPVEPTCFIKE